MNFDAEAIRRDLAENKGGVLEWIARDNDVPVLDIVRLLPESQRLIIDGPPMAELLDELTGWGEVMIIVQSANLVAEIVSNIPPATEGRGYFNFQGGTPFGGHLKVDGCQYLGFIDRNFAGRRSLSLAFYDETGEGIFKIFVRRDEDRELLSDQVEKFEALREKMENQH